MDSRLVLLGVAVLVVAVAAMLLRPRAVENFAEMGYHPAIVYGQHGQNVPPPDPPSQVFPGPSGAVRNAYPQNPADMLPEAEYMELPPL